MKLITLLLLFCILPQRAIADNFFKKTSNKAWNASEKIPVLGNWIKSARTWLGGAKEDELLDLQRKQVETSKSSLEKMQQVARDILQLKRDLEETAAIKRQGQHLVQDLMKAKYLKVGLGITEKLTAISLNPSDYIPNIDHTRSLKRKSSFSYYREKALLGNIDSFSNRIGMKKQHGIEKILADMHKELLQSKKITIAAKEANLKLIPIYQEQIKELAEQNKQINKTLQDKRFAKNDPMAFFTLQSLKNKNNIMIGDLIEKINRIQIEAEQVTKDDQKNIQKLADELFYQEVNKYKQDTISRMNRN